jgi:hypothetical protein
MQAYTRTTNVNRAAALSTLGIEIQVDQTTDLRTGKGWKTLLIANESSDVLATLLKPKANEKPHAPKHQTKLILSLLEKGTLASADPHHPLLDMLGACANREALLHWLKTGTAHRVARIQGARRTALVPGDEPESIKLATQTFRTKDIKLAAALTRLGVPIAKLVPIEGPGSLCHFHFPLAGYALDEPAIVTADLVNAYRSGTLPAESPEHSLLWMMQCLINREAILDFMFRQTPTILIRAPGTGRASLVRQDATPACLDKVRQRLGITY